MQIDRLAAQRAFADYVRAYDPSDPKIALKIAHTYRVAALCETIAESIGLLPEDTDLAWAAGLLHDVGRFEQVRRFGTFNDALSVDHAAEGARILFAQGHIRDYLPDAREDALLETAIRSHSLYRLPDTLTARERTYCDILRDADKVDILRVNCDTPLTDIYNVTPAALRATAVTPAVKDCFFAHRAVLRTLKKTPADNVVGLASLAFELVYPASIAAVLRQGYLEKLLCFDTANADTAALLRAMRTELARWFAVGAADRAPGRPEDTR